MITTNKVAIYVRVSTTSQADEGYSIEEQIDKLTTYCSIKDWTVYHVYTDGGFTGSNTKRPALEQLIKDAKNKHFDTVLVYKLDRLSRSQKDTLYLIEDVFLENNIDFLSLQENFDTSTPFGKAMIGLLSVFAQLEREQIKERMQLGKVGRAKSGKPMMWSKPAYGYSYDATTSSLLINEYEASMIRDIYARYLSGMSITKIRDGLNDVDSYDTGKIWSYRAVRMILSNPVYCGYNQFKGKVYLGNHEPIISEEDFEIAQREIRLRQIETYEFNNNSRPFQAKYMLSGIIKCGYCGAPQTVILGGKRKTKPGRTRRYECKQRHPRKTKGVTVYNNNEKCHSGSYLMDDIEQYVLFEISKLQNDKKEIDSIFDVQLEKIDRDNIQKQIDELSDKIKRLNDLYINNRITLDDLQSKANEFEVKKTFLIEQLENDPAFKSQENKRKMIEVLKCEDILNMDYEEQKNVVNLLIDKVIVTAEEIKIMWKI